MRPAPHNSSGLDAWHDDWTRVYKAGRAIQAASLGLFPAAGLRATARPRVLTSTSFALPTEHESGDFSIVPFSPMR